MFYDSGVQPFRVAGWLCASQVHHGPSSRGRRWLPILGLGGREWEKMGVYLHAVEGMNGMVWNKEEEGMCQAVSC